MHQYEFIRTYFVDVLKTNLLKVKSELDHFCKPKYRHNKESCKTFVTLRYVFTE